VDATPGTAWAGPPRITATSLPVDSAALSSAVVRIDVDSTPAYESMPTASAEAVTSSRAIRGAEANRRIAK
jgi:hypothetical protein